MEGGAEKIAKGGAGGLRRPDDERAEDLDTARLVTRHQAGDRRAFDALYLRYFTRVFTYLRVALNQTEEAEDAAQEVFTRVFEALPRYERRKQPFRAWLFTITRNVAITQLQRQGRLELVDPAELDARRERSGLSEDEIRVLGWLSDSDLLVFVEKLPLPQRQVLLLRFMLDLRSAEIARILDFTPDQVRGLQRRALLFIEKRLRGVGRAPADNREQAPMRRWGKQATVLRERRFALGPGP